jgi:NAD(P)-dependent dehydrogenase (short-subunit alcohol dehydrogenase family)
MSRFDLFALAGKRAIVTGGAQGFGAAIARRLGEAGAAVVVADRSVEHAARFVATLADDDRSISATAAYVDVADEASVIALFDAHGPVDVVVNNAGVFSNYMAVDLPVEEFDRIMSVNARGAFLCSREFARRALASPASGRCVVNVASVDALAPSCEGQVHYTSSKHAIAGLTKALSTELAPKGIRVNAVCPGASRTEGAIAFVQHGAPEGIDLAAQWDGIASRTPMGALIDPTDVADAVLFLASALARRITGVLLPVDAGILSQPLEGYTGDER